MKNTQIFNDYDMVVSVTQKTINDQLTHLGMLGVIPSKLILMRTVDSRTGDFDYQVLQSSDQIPRDGSGKPTVECIECPDESLQAQIRIDQSGTDILLLLNFLSGTAYFRDFESPDLRLKPFDMMGWVYAIDVTLDLVAVERDDIGKKITVPPQVANQLRHFMDQQFSVSHLFLNFNSVDLVRFNPTETKTPGNAGPGQILFVDFMIRYLKSLIASGNPYILGYSLAASDKTKFPDNKNVPDAIKPVGTTFTLYRAGNPDRSNLNFVLATKGGHGKITGSPGNFDTNWIKPNEQLDAKMIYSHSVLLEKLVLEPFFNQLSSGVYQQIEGKIDVGRGNDYRSARTPTPNGFNFSISNVNRGNDQYVNNFSVTIQNAPASTTLEFKGQLHFYKGTSQSDLCVEIPFIDSDAEAGVTVNVDWSGNLVIASAKKAGEPTLTLSNSFKIDHSEKNEYANKCAKLAKGFLSGLGKALDALTAFQDNDFFSNLFVSLLDLNPSIGNVGVALSNLPNAVQNVIVLPAGNVFFFKNVAVDSEGNLSLELAYKVEN